MATDRFGKLEEDASTTINSGVSLLKTAVGLSPVAIGIWQGMRRLKSNEAVNNPIARSTPSQTLGRAQGLAGRRAQRARNTRAAKVVEKLREGLSNNEQLRGIISQVEQHNALLQTLSVSLEDPASGLNTTAVQSLKSEIEGLLSKGSPDSIEQFASRAIDSLLQSGSPEVLMKWQENLHEFSGISGQLETPNFSIPKSGIALNPVDVGGIRTRISQKKAAPWERRFGRLESSLPQGHRAQVFSFSEGGVQFRQAQIIDERGSWVTNVGLGEDQFLRQGKDFNTLYAQPKYAMNVNRAYQSFRQGTGRAGSLGVDDMRKSGSVQLWNDYVIDEIGRQSRSGVMNWGNFRKQIDRGMQGVNRAATIDGSFGSHIRRQALGDVATIFGHSFGNMDGNTATSFIAGLAQGQGMDPGAAGAKRLVTGFGADRTSIIGLTQGSGFSQLQASYGNFAVDRTQLPITYREAQITGRPSMAVDALRKVGAVYSGGTGQRSGLNMGWGGNVTGGLNKMMVMDFSAGGALNKALGDTGVGYTGVSHEVLKPVEFSVLNPRKHGYAASSTLNQLMSGQSVNFSPEELAQGLYVGETGSGRKYMSQDPSSLGVTAQFDRHGNSFGKEMLYFKGFNRRKMDFLKLFSFGFKGNMKNVGEAGIANLFAKDKRLGIMEQGLVDAGITGTRFSSGYVSSDMASKGSFFFTHQISGTARMFGVSQTALKKRAEQLYKAGGGRLGKQGHQLYAQAAFELMRKRGVSPANIGMALAGVWNGAKGTGKYGIEKGSLIKMLQEGGLSTSEVKIARGAMTRGIVSFMETASIGPSIGDYGTARVGTEGRFAKTAMERMTQLGMGQQEAADMVANIYTKKVGFGKDYAMAEQLLGLGRSITGQRNAIDAFTERGAKRVKYGNLDSVLMANQGTGKLNDFLRLQKEGMVIDFADAPEHIRRAVQDTFNNNSLYLPGTPAYQAGSGTSMRQAGGQSVDIASAYGQMIKSLQGRLDSHSVSGGDALRASLKEWRGEGVMLLTESIAGLSKGKLSGSSSPRVDELDLNRGLTLTRKALRQSRRLTIGTAGSAVFADATMFLSELHNQAGQGSSKELADTARMFFTGMEHKADKSVLGSGLVRLSGRHPIISAGNAFFTQLFRDPTEVSNLGGDDKFFSKFASTLLDIPGKGSTSRQVLGKDYMKQIFNQDIRSFQDIAALSGDKSQAASRQLFQTLISNINKFTGGEGGGRLIVPRLLTDAHGDVGLSPQAYMDMDGDNALSVTLSSKDSHRIKTLLKKHNADPASIASELQSRAFKTELGGMIKKGMSAYGNTLGGIGGEDASSIAREILRHDTMKEIGMSQSMGAMDVRLRPMHDALFNYSDDINKQRTGRDLLGALNENVILKAKHIEQFVPVADELGLAIQGVINNPGDDSGNILRNLLKEKIFRDQGNEVNIGQMRVSGIDNLDNWLSKATSGGELNWNIDDSVDEMVRVSRLANAGGTAHSTTARARATALNRGHTDAWANILSGMDMETAALRAATDNPQAAVGVVGKFTNQVGAAIGKIDRRMIVPLSIGVAASIFAMGAVGSPGYASTSLSSDGEYISPEVSAAIAQGSLFGNSGGDVSPDDLQSRSSSDYGMMNRPINPGSTTMQRSTAYGIRGDISSGSGLGAATGYINQLTGGNAFGSIRINDTRRPISKSYSDRLMGEY